MDREFWFAVPEVTSQHADRPIKIHISSNNRDAYINISIPANPSVTPIELFLDAQTSETIDLTDWISFLENTSYNSVQDKGLLIESDEMITVYYEVLGSSGSNVYNTDIFVFKGGNALGTEFFTPFQNRYNNVDNNYVNNAWSTIDVVATEDNTLIQFELTNDAFNSPVRTFSINLNRGQTYSVRNATRIANERFSGSKVTSNKPIAVTIKDDSIKKENEGSYDLVGDQLIPTSLIDLNYILLEGESFVLATEDNTDITVGGIFITTIDKGETYYRNNSYNIFLEASNPVYVFQLTQTGGEYGGAILPHISCTGSYKVNFSRATSENFNVILLVKNGSQGNFLVNGEAGVITAADFQVVTGTNAEWYGAKKELFLSQIPEGEISKIENTDRPFHLGIINGSGSSGSRYGYFSNFNILDLGIDFDACDNTILEVESGLDTYEWSNGDLTPTTQIDSSGLYWVKGTEGACETIDTINVLIKPGITYELGGDTFLCADTLSLFAPDTFGLDFLWNNGDTTRELQIVDTGTYSLKITNKYDCISFNELYVDEFSLDEIGLNDTVICNDKVFINLDDGKSSFLWFTDNDTVSKVPFIEITAENNYYVERKNKCGIQIDSFFAEKRNVLMPNIFTPNNDGINDDFKVELGAGQWSLDIYNRWGKNILNNDDFKGDFSGFNISDGLYFYAINDKYCDKVLKGWIQIVR